MDRFLDIKEFYDKNARFYDIVHHLNTLYADNLHRISVAQEALLQDGDLLLDIGTGTSMAAICAVNVAFPEKKIRIVGVDLSTKMLFRGKENIAHYHMKSMISTINCDARYLPIRDNIFTTAISVYGIGGIRTGLKRAFKEFTRALRDRSILSLGEMTAPPREKGLLWRKIHEIVTEPLVNLVWRFKDLNINGLFHLLNIKVLKRKYFDTKYFGSMTLMVGRLEKLSDL